MIVRPAGLVCDLHRQHIVDTRIWPKGLAINPTASCPDCRHVQQQLPAGPNPVRALPTLDPRTLLAIHEAGHAVIHCVQGTPVEFAELDGDRGLVRIGGDGYQRIEGILAGAAAVDVWAARNGLTAAADAVDVAWMAEHDFLALHDHGVTVPAMTRLLEATDLLVADRWPAIERVAAVLARDGRLTGGDITLLAGCPQ